LIIGLRAWFFLFFDRIYRICRIFFTFPEERQKVSALFEETNCTKSDKSLAQRSARVVGQVPFSRPWAGLCFLSLVWRLRKIENPKILLILSINTKDCSIRPLSGAFLILPVLPVVADCFSGAAKPHFI